MKAIHTKQIVSAIIISLVLMLGLTGLSLNALGAEPAKGWEFLQQSEVRFASLNAEDETEDETEEDSEKVGFKCPASYPVFNGCDLRHQCAHSCPTWRGGIGLIDRTKKHCDVDANPESRKAGYACCCRNL